MTLNPSDGSPQQGTGWQPQPYQPAPTDAPPQPSQHLPAHYSALPQPTNERRPSPYPPGSPLRQDPVTPAPYQVQVGAGRMQSRQFAFDGGAATYFGTALLGFLITVLTLGLCYPFALVLRERWRAKHSFIEGRQLAFTGSGWGLFGLWWKWLLLMIITVGIYSFWVGPRVYRWKWEHTSWAQQVPSTVR